MPKEFTTGTGQKLVNVHQSNDCFGEHCPIHNPSERAERIGVTHWREDRGFMERICSHGVGHPDPDAALNRWGDQENIHGCCGCCWEVKCQDTA